MASIPQFERRRISERISAIFNSRAQRGLYNGGPFPLGLKRVDGKPGYLEIEKTEAEIVKTAFKAFIREGSLASAARSFE